MYSETEDVIRALAENAESVCRAYLPAGRREGSYWIVGDLQNNPGRSLFVRLTGPASGPGAAGKFTDGATGEHGDLLDIIRDRTGISRFPDLLAEARAHLGRPQPVVPDRPVQGKAKAPGGTPAAAARLFAASVPVAGTLADTYLRAQGLTRGSMMSALRFHPKCWHRDEGQTRSLPRPALIAAVTDGAGVLQGVHRTWLAPDGQGKAVVETQRRALGHLLGNAVRLTAEGLTLIERRNCMDMMRDHAATEFVHHTGSAWRPRTGSMVNRQHMTAALIDSRDFLAAKRRAETEVMLPAGPKVALTGGTDFNDHRLIWGKLDQVRTKYPDMVLLHGGSPKGAELIAAKWAESRGVTQVAFKPDWTKHAKAAPFKRNDAMLDVLPVGVLVFPGNGIQENLADKAKKLGIPVMKFEKGA